MKPIHAAPISGAALALLVAVGAPALAATDSTTLTNGAELTVTLDPAGSNGTYLIPEGDTNVDVPFTGDASVGEGEPNVHWTYVIDVSGSTVNPCGGGLGTILDCEKAAVMTLNATVVADGSALDVGLAVFGEVGASADMSDDAGNQPINAPNVADVTTVINSVTFGGVAEHTARNVGQDATNYAAGLAAALTSVSASSAASKNVVFLSDGASNAGAADFPAALGALAGQATIYSFAVGTGTTCGSGSAGTLQAIAEESEGTCTNVPDPSDLPDIVENVTATELSSIAMSANATLDSVMPSLPAAGPETADFTATANDLTPGTHSVCASATGLGPTSDPTSEQTVTACEDVDVYAFALAPATATNELGEDNAHTVTATLTGPAGSLEGFSVDFVVAGANAGATGTCVPASCETDAAGQVTFTYQVPVESDSLGTDTITGTVTIDDETGPREVEKEWVDMTPPVAMCVEGPNPSGKIPAAPGKGGQAQNPDGFWTISAEDDVWADADVEVYVRDSGSGTVFGPYANPTNIKYVQAPGGSPTEEPGPGVVDVFLKGTGDAQVHAVDGSGNISEPVDCLVPPPPK